MNNNESLTGLPPWPVLWLATLGHRTASFATAHSGTPRPRKSSQGLKIPRQVSQSNMAANEGLENGCVPSKRTRTDDLNAVSVVLGAQWGDEGKGKIVDLLATSADVVCRCQVGVGLLFVGFGALSTPRYRYIYSAVLLCLYSEYCLPVLRWMLLTVLLIIRRPGCFRRRIPLWSCDIWKFSVWFYFESSRLLKS